VRVELGPRVAERVRAFEIAYDGGCGHEADQWSGVGSLRSSCLDCLRTAGPLAPWERAGPCDVCGRLLPETAPRTWAVPSTSTRVVVVLRLCDECVATEVLALGEPGDGGDVDTYALARRMTGKPWAPALTAAAGGDLPCCERCYTFTQAAAVSGIAERLPLHAACHRSLTVWATAAFSRDPARKSRAERIADARGVLALAAAVIR
jgi:hypothetical protein